MNIFSAFVLSLSLFLLSPMFILFGLIVIQVFLYVVAPTVKMDAIWESEILKKVLAASALLGAGFGFYQGIKTDY
jgi:type VI protein secretion system component VasK